MDGPNGVTLFLLMRATTMALALTMGVVPIQGRADVHEQKQDKRPHRTDTREVTRPAWSDLSLAQRQVLTPLAPTWHEMNVTQRKRWVEIAARYPAMSPEEQQRLQKRMVNWARLSPAERQRARTNYQKLQNLPSQRRQEVIDEWRRHEKSIAGGEQLVSPLESTLTGSREAEEPAQEAELEQQTSKRCFQPDTVHLDDILDRGICQ